MLYIITEDSKSGFVFWKTVCEAFLSEDEYEIKAASGNQELKKNFDCFLAVCEKTKDEILLIFDNIENNSIFNPGNLISYCSDKCFEKKVGFYFSDFYCFESIFLSYSEMLDMTSGCKPIMRDTIQYVNTAINEGIGYWESTDEIVDVFLENSGISAKNREHFENELLSIATHGIKYGYFHIKKATFDKGKCWIRSCAEIQTDMNSHVVEKDCDRACHYVSKRMDTMLKINDIVEKSILAGSKIIGLIRKESHVKNL